MIRSKPAPPKPDWAVINSRRNSEPEDSQKRRLYEASGVREYWLIDPVKRIAVAYQLQSPGIFKDSVTLGDEETLVSAIFTGLKVDLAAIFPFKLKVVCENPPPADR